MAGESTKIDSLQIEVKANSKTAATALGTLRKSLIALRDTLDGGDTMQGLMELSKALDSLSTGTATVKSFSSSVRSMSGNLDKSVSSMKRFNNAVIETVMTAGTAAGQMKDLGLSFDMITQTPSSSLDALLERLDAIGGTVTGANDTLVEMSANLKHLGATSAKTEKHVGGLQKQVGALSGSLNSALKPLKKFLKSIARIGFYRAIRTALKNLAQGIKEGRDNLEAYSREVGTAFAPALDNLRQHVLLLKNSFATALRPAIEAIIPYLIQFVDWLSRIADFIAQVLSVLTGKVDDKGRYTKAVLGDLQQSNKEAKELRRTLLGFDEINRLDGEKGSGDSNSAGMDFIQADVSDKAKEVAGKLEPIIKKIKDFIKSIDWATVGKVVAGIAGLFAGAKIAGAIGKVVGFVKTIFGIVKTIWPVIKAIVGGISPVAGIVIAIVAAFAIWGDKIAAFFDNIQRKGNAVFDWIDDKLKFSKGLTAISKFQRTIFNLVTETVGTTASMVYKLFHGDFKGALKDLVHLIATVVKGVIGLVVGFANIFLGIVDDIIYYAKIAAQFIYNKAIVPVVNALATFFAKIKVAVHNAVVDLKIGVQTVIKWIMEKVNDLLLGPLTKTINSAILVWNKVMKDDIQPVDLTVDTTKFDDKIEDLKQTKLPPITETVTVAAEWSNKIERLGLEIDTTGIYNAIDNVEKKLNNAIDSIGKKVNYVSSAYDAAGNMKPGAAKGGVGVQKFASGGFPSAGSLFIAGEGSNGPEFVGNVGGATGVWNSDQLVTALYNAFASALAANPSGGDIYLDGEVIYKNTVRRNNNQVRSTGRSALLT